MCNNQYALRASEIWYQLSHYLVIHRTQEISSQVVQSFLQYTRFESEDRLDFGSTSEIDRVEVCYCDMEGVLATIHQFEQGRHHSHSTLQWLFRCRRHLGVLTPHAILSLHRSLSLDRLVRYATRNRYRVALTRWNTDQMRERIVHFYFFLRSITEHFDHRELIHRCNWGRNLIIHIFYRQLELEFAVQSHDITF